LRATRHSDHRQVDLVAALGAVAPRGSHPRHRAIADAVVASGIDRSLVRQLGSRQPVRRAVAALLVAGFALPDAANIIAPLVRDRDGDVRLAAVRALDLLADDAAALQLVDALQVRDLAVERVIERLGAPWTVPVVLDVLDGRRSGPGSVRRADAPLFWRSIDGSLARALGLAGDPRAERALRSLLRYGRAEERIHAARALGTAGTMDSVPDLERSLDDEAWPVRAQAARALGRLGSQSSVPALAPHLADTAWWVRAAAADALADLGEPGIAVLRDALAHPDPYARDRAREALALHQLGGDDG